MVEKDDVGALQACVLVCPQYVVPQFADATLARETVATATAAPLKIRDTIIHLYCYKSAVRALVGSNSSNPHAKLAKGFVCEAKLYRFRIKKAPPRLGRSLIPH